MAALRIHTNIVYLALEARILLLDLERSKWGLSNRGLRPLSAMCAQSPRMMHFCGPFVGGSLVGVWNGWEYGIVILRALKFNFRSPKFGKDRSLSAEFQGFSRKFRPPKNVFSDSGKWPFRAPPVHTPTKCRPILCPFLRGTFVANDDNRRQSWTSTLSPHLLSPPIWTFPPKAKRMQV